MRKVIAASVLVFSWSLPATAQDQSTLGKVCQTGQTPVGGAYACYPYPNGQNYWVAPQANCAYPNTPGVYWNTETVVNNQKFRCTSGIGWQPIAN